MIPCAMQFMGGWAGVAMFQRWLCLVSCGLQASLFEASMAMQGTVGALQAAVPEPGSAVLAGLPFVGMG